MAVPLIFLLLLFLETAIGARLIPRNSSYACNNSPDLCSRSYANITHLGAHDSAFVTNSSTSSATVADAGNQNINSTAQLTAGVRLLTAQVHNNLGAWHLCHTTCSLLDAGTLSSWLSEIKIWLDAKPYDVVTILLVNSDNATADDLNGEFEAANIISYGFKPSSTTAPLTSWPTLQEMISDNARLVTFVTPLETTSTTPYLLSEFDYVFENPYNVTNATGFSCTVDRPSSLQGQTTAAVQSGYLPLVNHFRDTEVGFGIEVPDTADIATTNGASGVGSLGEAASSCTSAYGGRKPAFLLVDYFNEGSCLQVVDGLNSITATGRGTAPSSTTSKSGSGATFSSAATASFTGQSSSYLSTVLLVLMVTFLLEAFFY